MKIHFAILFYVFSAVSFNAVSAEEKNSSLLVEKFVCKRSQCKLLCMSPASDKHYEKVDKINKGRVISYDSGVVYYQLERKHDIISVRTAHGVEACSLIGIEKSSLM